MCVPAIPCSPQAGPAATSSILGPSRRRRGRPRTCARQRRPRSRLPLHAEMHPSWRLAPIPGRRHRSCKSPSPRQHQRTLIVRMPQESSHPGRSQHGGLAPSLGASMSPTRCNGAPRHTPDVSTGSCPDCHPRGAGRAERADAFIVALARLSDRSRFLAALDDRVYTGVGRGSKRNVHPLSAPRPQGGGCVPMVSRKGSRRRTSAHATVREPPEDLTTPYGPNQEVGACLEAL